jgi:hypothetical protein
LAWIRAICADAGVTVTSHKIPLRRNDAIS